eukprot:CAMPEP_0202448046 /NCGR_PEP_ID=MMETSP1360-20130828/6838_1 /ASSEMBLY_ACC=CAM_ASM_000848 /TAXON_ID=515479 /ORGANISM="Licmophora paradoxa, Strain CCMP2313" /LENGTH=94 /DNA_ID=CAMNT_0049065415 /DNA_START=45 /DNA_END=329 /DNA_ORIENTATION=-
MMRSTITRVATTSSRVPARRAMGAGPFPSGLNVKKNKFVEEWNGRREITEENFHMDQSKIPVVFIMCFLIPYGIYAWTRSELENSGDRRYKNLV